MGKRDFLGQTENAFKKKEEGGGSRRNRQPCLRGRRGGRLRRISRNLQRKIGHLASFKEMCFVLGVCLKKKPGEGELSSKGTRGGKEEKN